MDPVVLFGSQEAIKAAVDDCIAKAGPRGHVLNLGHGVLVGPMLCAPSLLQPAVARAALRYPAQLAGSTPVPACPGSVWRGSRGNWPRDELKMGGPQQGCNWGVLTWRCSFFSPAACAMRLAQVGTPEENVAYMFDLSKKAFYNKA